MHTYRYLLLHINTLYISKIIITWFFIKKHLKWVQFPYVYALLIAITWMIENLHHVLKIFSNRKPKKKSLFIELLQCFCVSRAGALGGVSSLRKFWSVASSSWAQWAQPHRHPASPPLAGSFLWLHTLPDPYRWK